MKPNSEMLNYWLARNARSTRRELADNITFFAALAAFLAVVAMGLLSA